MSIINEQNRVFVTQEHIDRGKGGNRSPVMLALRQHYSGKEVYKDGDMIFVHDPDVRGEPMDDGCHLTLSWLVNDWLRRHRRGEQLSPTALVVRYHGEISGEVYLEREIVVREQLDRERENARQANALQQAARPWWKKLLGW